MSVGVSRAAGARWIVVADGSLEAGGIGDRKPKIHAASNIGDSKAAVAKVGDIHAVGTHYPCGFEEFFDSSLANLSLGQMVLVKASMPLTAAAVSKAVYDVGLLSVSKDLYERRPGPGVVYDRASHPECLLVRMGGEEDGRMIVGRAYGLPGGGIEGIALLLRTLTPRAPARIGATLTRPRPTVTGAAGLLLYRAGLAGLFISDTSSIDTGLIQLARIMARATMIRACLCVHANPPAVGAARRALLLRHAVSIHADLVRRT